ncbi:WD-REPEATS-REGION domain-containing protein [Mycena indigotica]|uniref:methylated diphthine methylhydrolase n=1 Tax=Mycena indigotica TaxID=2126181 RepID=A0A8H6W8I0_9AGAR|nr:WD-REPEATS-REGION domain-containing protein [Mycena indigotica]KAF7306931.1 WD-REPEATS-REGION domain-containing protein [Mycena indigotica]
MDAFDTIFPADSVEFCPHPTADNIFVCGTYYLDASAPHGPTQKRTGQCLLFRIDQDHKVNKLQGIDLPAVPDMKWRHHPSDAPLLAIADSEGNISLHELQESQLQSHSSVACAPSDVLCLSLDWSNRRNTSPDTSLVVSLSNGSLCLLRLDDQGSSSGLRILDTWHAHDFEPWIAAWDYWDMNSIFSGGDDMILKIWDVRQGFTSPVRTNKRFEAGVTTIQSNPHAEHILAVGSYDNTVRVFDKRKLLAPFAQVDVGGGAWRVKWHPSSSRKDDLLVACMHDGFKVVRLAGESGQVIKRFDQHSSLAYGVDWSFAADQGETMIASCSFYDHTLHLWSG